MLRRAGDLLRRNTPPSSRDWLVRETGADPAKADFETHVAAQECYEASALASHPHGDVLTSSDAPLVLRPPPSGRGGRRRRPVQLPADPGDPLGRPGAGARQRGAAQARPAHRRVAAASASPRVFDEAGLPDGLLQLLPGGARSAPPWSPHPGCGSSPSPAPPRRAGPSASWRPSTSSACTWSSAATTPSIVLRDADLDGGRVRRRLRLVHPPGPDLHDHRTAPRPRLALRRVRRAARRARPSAPAGRRPVP